MCIRKTHPHGLHESGCNFFMTGVALRFLLPEETFMNRYACLRRLYALLYSLEIAEK